MSDISFPPTTLEEAVAAEREIARLYRSRIADIQAVFNGPEATAFQQALADVLAAGVPSHTAASSNLPNAIQWFDSIRTALDADFQRFDLMVGDQPEEPDGEAPPEEPAP